MRNLKPRPLLVEHVSIATLVPDPRNPRQHSERQVKQLVRSIGAFGFNVPLLVGPQNAVVAGHGRLLAAQRLGWTEVPIIRLTHLTPAQAKAFAIADNRLTEISTWDDRLLGEVFAELTALDLDFSIEDTGFTIGEIDLKIEGAAATAVLHPDPADEVPAPASTPPVSQPGDLWLLGEHRLLCGSALSDAAFETLMGSSKAAIVFTDPPYNVPIDGHVSGLGRIRHREFAMASGEMTEGQFTHFLTSVAHLMARYSTKGSIHYICMDWSHQRELLSAGQQAYGRLCNLCVWVKDNAGMGSLYRSQHELIFVFKNGAARHRNNVQLGRFGRNRTNVWSYPGVSGFGRKGEEGNLLAMHPTVKPVALIADALLDCSARRDIVLDPFLGSGSTLIAAERVGRRCRSMEIDPLYVDTAIRRWQRYSGQAAVHAVTGEAFDHAAARCEVVS